MKNIKKTISRHSVTQTGSESTTKHRHSELVSESKTNIDAEINSAGRINTEINSAGQTSVTHEENEAIYKVSRIDCHDFSNKKSRNDEVTPVISNFSVISIPSAGENLFKIISSLFSPNSLQNQKPKISN